MFKVFPDNKIKLTKGDIATLYVDITDLEDKPFDVVGSIVFTLKTTPSTTTASLSKNADSDHIITFLKSDTSSLNSGLYVYSITYIDEQSEEYTLVNGYFELEEDLH